MKSLLFLFLSLFLTHVKPSFASQDHRSLCRYSFLSRLLQSTRTNPKSEENKGSLKEKIAILKSFHISFDELSKTSLHVEKELSEIHQDQLISSLSHISQFLKTFHLYYDYYPYVFFKITSEHGLKAFSNLTLHQPQILNEMAILLMDIYGKKVRIRINKYKKTFSMQKLVMDLLIKYPLSASSFNQERLTKALLFFNDRIGKKHTLNLFVKDPITFFTLDKKSLKAIRFLEKKLSNEWLIKEANHLRLKWLIKRIEEKKGNKKRLLQLINTKL